jgi:competence protein ComEC
MSKKWRVYFLLVLLGLAIFFCYWQYFEKKKYHFSVVFFNIGQGDSALINFSDGEKMLADCGPNANVLSKLGSELPFYDRTIDYLVITHPDLDHYGGCVDVLKRYQIKNIIENGDEKVNDGYWQEWNVLAGQENAARTIINKEQTMSFGSEKIRFFFAATSTPGLLEGNNRSLVFKLTGGDNTFMFTGDAEYIEEDILLNIYSKNELKSDYLKVSHHGSDSSSSDNWLASVQPKVAIVSVGKNKFGHPSLRVLRKLERVGAEIWQTDEKGDILKEE